MVKITIALSLYYLEKSSPDVLMKNDAILEILCLNQLNKPLTLINQAKAAQCSLMNCLE